MKATQFLYIVPLKQGLKLLTALCAFTTIFVFIHSSIKTRIETITFYGGIASQNMFLYIVPLKQGLKLAISMSSRPIRVVFIHSSIKTRIETS